MLILISFTLGFEDARTGAGSPIFAVTGVAEVEASDVSIEERAGTLEKKVCLISKISVVSGSGIGGSAVEATNGEEGMLEAIGLAAGSDGLYIDGNVTGMIEIASTWAGACISTALLEGCGG